MIEWELSGTVGNMQYLRVVETNRRYCVEPCALVPSSFARLGKIAGNSEDHTLFRSRGIFLFGSGSRMVTVVTIRAETLQDRRCRGQGTT